MSTNTKSPIAVLGAGSWGTAVAIFLAQTGQSTWLWSRDSEHAQAMQEKRENTRYLPGIHFPDQLIPCSDLQKVITESEQWIIAVPSHAFASLLAQLPKPTQGIAWLTKGLDPSHHQLLSELIAQRWGASFPMAAISGPSFAREVALGLPTALVLASSHIDYQHSLHQRLHADHMRVYLSDDLCGVQLCGAVKNVLAIACGISDGIGYGANAKAALITRGLAEMQRLLKHYHARPETCLGLAGVGDLVLTCTDNQSRNRRFGLLLGQGHQADEAIQTIGQVIEGRYNAEQICALANEHQIDMPICQEVLAVLSNQRTPQEAVHHLMTRPPKDEVNIPSPL